MALQLYYSTVIISVCAHLHMHIRLYLFVKIDQLMNNTILYCCQFMKIIDTIGREVNHIRQ